MEKPLPELPRLLLVEDDASTLQVLTKVFRNDYAISVATSGADGLHLIQGRPDLVLLDLHLPDTDGLEVCRALKSDPSLQDIPVIFLTGNHDPEIEETGITLGAVDFVTKPFSAAILRARVRTHIDLKQKTDQLKMLISKDGLTGISNRRYFDEAIEKEWGRMRREKSPLSVVMVDIDHFKAINDTHGHQFGDEVLKQVARAIEGLLRRPGDHFARYGGEEFAIVLPSTDLDGAVFLAERVRQMVEVLDLENAPVIPAPSLTISLGCATVVPDASGNLEALIGEADENLYRAKQNGRNRVEPYASRRT